jgi:hypothetical protein
VTKVKNHLWQQSLAEDWPHLRARFLDLLVQASAQERAVVFLDHRLDHAIYVGDEGERVLVPADER